MRNGKKNYKFLSTIGLLFILSAASCAHGTHQADSIDKASVAVVDPDSIFTQPQKQPLFPGGEEEFVRYVRKRLVFPRATWLEGSRVVASFIVEKDGSITHVEVEKAPIFDIENSVTAVKDSIEKTFYSMPKWEPGTQDGLPVRTKYTFCMTICFQ